MPHVTREIKRETVPAVTILPHHTPVMDKEARIRWHHPVVIARNLIGTGATVKHEAPTVAGSYTLYVHRCSKTRPRGMAA